MSNEAPTVDDLLTAVAAAEANALAEHQAGTCHLSEWSCSHCEAAHVADEHKAEKAACRPVRVHAMRLGLRDDEPTREWFASCADADWSQGGRSCNWYGGYRETEAQAKADAARHRRSH